jgi:hypothetical protein
VLTRLRGAAQTARRLPALSAAARKAGASPLQAVQLIAVSGQALMIAARRASGEARRSNAVRHFIWQACVTARFGEDVARAIAEAQELGTRDASDSEVDRQNNAVGQRYGRRHADEIRSGSTHAALIRLVDVAMAKWDAGKLSS